jgi:hypothetical protein
MHDDEALDLSLTQLFSFHVYQTCYKTQNPKKKKKKKKEKKEKEKEKNGRFNQVLNIFRRKTNMKTNLGLAD